MIRWEKVEVKNAMIGKEGEGGGPGKRWCHTCNSINGGRHLYVFGGYDKDDRQTNQVYVFDTVNQTWSQPAIKGIPPTPRDSHTCSVVGHRLFVFGGTDEKNQLKDLHILDTSLQTWDSPIVKGEGPEAREGHSAAVVGKCLFIFGGFRKSADNDNEVYYNDLYILNTETLVWTHPTTLGMPPSPRANHTCSSWKNKIIVIGGIDERDSYLSDVHILDTDTLIWRELSTSGQLLAPRSAHSTVSFGKNLFVFGGCTDASDLCSDIYMLDIDTGIWTNVTNTTNCPSARYFAAGDCLDPINGVFVFIGGCNKSNEALDDMYYLFTGSARESEQRPEKLSMKKQLNLKCQEEQNIIPGQNQPTAVPLDPSKKFKEKNQQQPLDVIESSDEEKTPKKRTRSKVSQTSAESSATEIPEKASSRTSKTAAEEKEVTTTPSKRKPQTSKELEDSKKFKRVHDVMIEPTSTEDAMDDAQLISTMFPQPVTSSAPSSKVHKEHVSSFAKGTTAKVIETVIKEVNFESINVSAAKSTKDIRVLEGDNGEEGGNKEPSHADKEILKDNEDDEEVSEESEGKDHESSHATSPSKKEGSDGEEHEILSKESPEPSSINTNMLDGLSIPLNMVDNPSDVEFDVEEFQNKLKQNPLAVLDDIISSFSTSKDSIVPLCQGSETSKSSEMTADSLIQELHSIAFERDLLEISKMSSFFLGAIDSFKPKIIAHEKLFTPQQLEHVQVLIQNLEALLKADQDLEAAKEQKIQADKEVETRLQEVTATRSEIEVQQKKVEELISKETEIDNEIAVLRGKIEDLETKKKLSGPTKEIANKHLELVVSKVVGQVSRLNNSKAKVTTTTSRINSTEQQLYELKSVYLKLKEHHL